MIIKLMKYFISLCYWSRQPVEKVRAMQLRKFKEVFEYAREHSKFYHELYKNAGVLDLEIKTWDDVKRVPVVTKSMMRAARTDDILTRPFDPRLHNTHTTSGSSGTPFKIVYDKWVDYTGHVRLLWLLMKHGYTPFKKMTLLSRYTQSTKFEIENDVGIVKRLQKLLKIFRRDIISIFEDVDTIIRKLKDQKPFVLWTTPAAIILVAQELARRNERIEIPLLLLMSETYTAEQLKLLKERVCANFVDNYGCMELPTMGEGYNQMEYKILIPNFVLAEVFNVREVGREVVGDYVVTNLLNKTMPFVRYSLGDYVGVLNDATFPFVRIGKVYGRCDDIIDYRGKSIYFHQIYELYTDFTSAEQFKLYQYRDGRLEFQIKIRQGVVADEAIQDAQTRWRTRFSNIPIEVVAKEDLPIDQRTGKFKVIEKER